MPGTVHETVTPEVAVLLGLRTVAPGIVTASRPPREPRCQAWARHRVCGLSSEPAPGEPAERRHEGQEEEEPRGCDPAAAEDVDVGEQRDHADDDRRDDEQ